MGEEPVHGSIEVAAIAGHEGRDKFDDGFRHLQPRIALARSLDAAFEDPPPEILVEVAEFDREAAGEPRFYTLVDPIEFSWRTIGRKYHLLTRIAGLIDDVTELLLYRPALEELHIVDDQEVESADLVLELDRGLRLQGRDELLREAISRQIEGTLALRLACVRHGL